MNNLKTLLLIGAAVLATSADASTWTKTIKVDNTVDHVRKDVPVVVTLTGKKTVSSVLVYKLSADGTRTEVPCQTDDLDADDVADELCFLADLGPNEHARYELLLSDESQQKTYPARVYAEMLVRNDKVKEKNRHNNYLESITARGDCANSYNVQHHHGVCFESELNGIRIYFDKRQTLDLYGKHRHRLELQQTQFYPSDQQKAEGYGDDVLWVGQTFGLGAFRGWDGQAPTMIEPVRSRTQRVVSYGPLRTIVEIVDRGWQPTPSAKPITLTIRYTQYAGHRDTDVDVFFSRDVSQEQFSTGIIAIEGAQLFSDQMGLRGCWGADFPGTDTVKFSRETLGMGIWLPKEYLTEERAAETDDKGLPVKGSNLTFVVNTKMRHLRYRVAYCYLGEENGPKSAEEWFEWLRRWKDEAERSADFANKRLKL